MNISWTTSSVPLQWTGIGKYTCLTDFELVADTKMPLLLVQHLPVPPFLSPPFTPVSLLLIPPFFPHCLILLSINTPPSEAHTNTHGFPAFIFCPHQLCEEDERRDTQMHSTLSSCGSGLYHRWTNASNLLTGPFGGTAHLCRSWAVVSISLSQSSISLRLSEAHYHGDVILKLWVCQHPTRLPITGREASERREDRSDN